MAERMRSRPNVDYKNDFDGPIYQLRKDTEVNLNLGPTARSPAGGQNRAYRSWRSGGDIDSDEEETKGSKPSGIPNHKADVSNKHNSIVSHILMLKTQLQDCRPLIDDKGQVVPDVEIVGSKTKAAIDQYLMEQKNYLDRQGSDEGTLLHRLSKGYPTETNCACRDYVAEFLLKQYPMLLHKKDNSDNTPLCSAVQGKATDFIACLFDKSTVQQRRTALTEMVAGGQTCLTMAIKTHSGGPITVVRALIDLSRSLLPKPGKQKSTSITSDCEAEVNILSVPDDKGNTPLHHLLKNKKFSAQRVMELLQTLLNLSPDSITMLNQDRDTPFMVRQKFLDSTVDNCPMADYAIVREDFADASPKYKYKYLIPSDPQVRNSKVRDQASELLKLHCMMYHSMPLDVLYKSGEDQRSVYLDLTSYHQRKIKYENLAYMAIPEFETILQFVRIPQIQVEPPLAEIENTKKRAAREIRMLKAPEKKPRRDFEYIFRWLKEQGVLRILEIEVTDFGGGSSSPGLECHSDEVIEKALSPFDIRIWHWKRYDICSGTILAAAPNVGEIYLYSKGNRAVLWGWSGTDGLNRLKQLRRVNLIINPELDSQERAEKNEEDFVSRMKKNCPNVAVHTKIDFYVHLGSGGNSGDDDAVESSDRWMDIMRGWANLTMSFAPPPPDSACRRLKPVVAILDDGIDVMREEIKDRLIGGRSFKQSPDGLRVSGWQVGQGSHGTTMASLVLKMCPQATILPIRLDTRKAWKRGAGALCFTIRSAADAIMWATSQDVDIISMSWSIEAPPADFDEDVEYLKAALTKAQEKDILLFCATSDHGNVTSEKLYPGSCLPNGIFRIGAATSTGDPSAKVASGSHNVDFIFPGENVEVDAKQVKDGSSIATALAAGMAAMLLLCCDNVMPPEDHKKVRSYGAIHKAFRTMKAKPDAAPRVKEFFEVQPEWHNKVKSTTGRIFMKRLMQRAGILDDNIYNTHEDMAF